MTNLDSVLKNRDITLLANVRIAMVFPVVMYRCESWTIKKAEHQRIDAFALWCWRRVLRVPWIAGRSNQSILKEINPEYLGGFPGGSDGNQPWIFIGRTNTKAEAPILWPPDAKNWLIEKDPDAGTDWGHEEKGATEDKMVGWHHWLNGHEFEQILGDNKDNEAWRAAVHSVARSQTWLSDWTATKTWEQTLLHILDHKISPILHPLFKTRVIESLMWMKKMFCYTLNLDHISHSSFSVFIEFWEKTNIKEE